MAVTPVNMSRVSFNMRAYNLLESLRANQAATFGVQNQLATGLSFLRPSESPVNSAAAMNIDRRIDRLDQVQSNLTSVNNTLLEVDTTMQETLELLSEAQALAVQAVGDTITEDERHALVTVVDSLLNQMVSLGNRQFLNTYLFSGHQAAPPFEFGLGGVLYKGDANRMETIIDTDLSKDSFTVPGMEFFQSVSSGIQGVVDLNPALTDDTLITDLNGARGNGVTLGIIVVSTDGDQTSIDLRGAATIGDAIDKLNDGLPQGVSAALGTNGITLTRTIAAAGTITVAESSGTSTAADFGLLGSFNAASRLGDDLDPRLTVRTPVSALNGGAGIDLSRALTIRNGGQSATISLADADTLEAILNRINNAGVGAWARLAGDGNSIEVLSRLSGTDLSIEEDGGLTATNLGVRTMHAGIALSALNDGAGIETVTGNDLRITTADGTAIDVDLSAAITLHDVFDQLNTNGAGAITAAFVTKGNGLLITDNTAGPGTLTIEALDNSPAVGHLGLDVTAAGGALVGNDVSPVRVDSPFTGLLELSRGMGSDDRNLMMKAGARIDDVMKTMQGIQGEMASLARAMEDRAERISAEGAAAQVMMSDVRDVDFTEAAVRFQRLQTALQANLSTATQVMNLSVLDYLS